MTFRVKKRFRLFLSVFLIPLFAISSLLGQSFQYQASNRMEYRIYRSDKKEEFRNWFDVDYTLGEFLTGLRLLLNQPSNANEVQAQLLQRYFEMNQGNFRLRLGNFYKRFGRGMLLHSFEIQRISLNRIDQNFIIDRNLDGFLLEWNGQRSGITVLSAQPKWGFQSRNLRAVEGFFYPLGSLKLYSAYLRENHGLPTGKKSREFLNCSLEWNGPAFSLYVDLAGDSRLNRFGKSDHPKAIYSSLSYFTSNLGINLEYKDYRDFFTGLNNPPTLIREHPYSLLNRHSHQLQLTDEKGYQLEVSWAPSLATSFLLNLSQAGNHDWEKDSRFGEIYVQARQELGPQVGLLGIDWSRDRLIGDNSRFTLLTDWDFYLKKAFTLNTDIQIQQIKNIFLGKRFNNLLMVLGVNQAGKFALSFQFEKSTDPREKNRTWTMLNFNWKIRMEHDLYVSIGRRRAGLACASGQCVFVPEFEGIEIRLNSRF